MHLLILALLFVYMVYCMIKEPLRIVAYFGLIAFFSALLWLAMYANGFYWNYIAVFVMYLVVDSFFSAFGSRIGVMTWLKSMLRSVGYYDNR